MKLAGTLSVISEKVTNDTSHYKTQGYLLLRMLTHNSYRYWFLQNKPIPTSYSMSELMTMNVNAYCSLHMDLLITKHV